MTNDSDNCPPYDIARTAENRYQTKLALAGLSPEKITIAAQRSTLTVDELGQAIESDARTATFRRFS
jgi:HSP20 family molecular chaperone IbpA